MKSVILLVIPMLFLCGTANATTWYVHPDSTLNSIQAALDFCADNDTVLVAPGFYIENITWPSTDGIHLNSEYGPDTTIIDGNSAGIVITITTGVDSATVIDGFTIQNGAAYNAGGIYCYNYSSPTISNNIITGNSSGYGGGGIACYMYSSPTITGNTFTNNTTPYGGGIGCRYHSSPTITSNTIMENTGTRGGGILCIDNCSPVITGNTIMENTCARGGGIYCSDNCSPIITGNTITGNTANIFGGGISCCNNSSPTITGNTITGNTADTLGGGIACSAYASPTITGNTITGNESFFAGGGIGCYLTTSPTITSNTITGNTAAYAGGGIASMIASPTVTDNIITNNATDSLGGGLALWQSSPIITHNTIEANTALCGGGIGCDLSSLGIIDSCTISGNNGDGVYCDHASSPVINYCNISSNTGYGVRNLDPSVTVNADSNWWGDLTGPYHPTANPGGLGDTVSDYVDFDPWLNDSVQGIGIQEIEIAKPSFLRLQVTPNPFRDKVSITFSRRNNMETMAFIIYDATGRVVKEFNGLTDNHILWNGTDNLDRRLPSGVYFLKLQAGDDTTTEKLLLIR